MLKLKNLIRIGLGSVFIMAAILKLISVDEFEIYIYSFNIFSFLITTFVSRLIIAGEFILGLLLIFRINYKFTWRASLIILVSFTLFLIYTAIFRQDSNCHCFGELVELNPLESIVKNMVMIVLLLIAQQPKVTSQQPKSNRLKLLLIINSTLFIVFIISPPDSIYKMIYSTDKEVSSVDLYESFDEAVKIDFNEEDLVFDSVPDFNIEGKQLIVIVSSGCKYCRLGLKKLSMMMEKEDISPENVDVFIWGSREGIMDFRKETMTEEYSYWHIMPNKAIDVTYGRFPVFIWLENKNIINIGDFRDIDDAFLR